VVSFLAELGTYPASGHRGCRSFARGRRNTRQTQARLRIVFGRGLPPLGKASLSTQIIKVGAEELAFNIDILHPNEQGRRGMFADHIELPVPLTPFLKQQLRMKSIAVPASRFIFTYQRIRTVSVEQTASSGEKMATAVPVMDEAGLIVTKSYSFRNPKRSRDLFDIYLAVKQCGDRPEVTSFLRRLKKEVSDTFNTLHAIEAAMTRTPGLLASVNEHLPEPLREPEDSILACLVAFLREAGVDAVDDAACQEDVVLE
jgi:hypothetical protein